VGHELENPLDSDEYLAGLPLSEPVLARVAADYSPEHRAEVERLLAYYGADPNHSEVERIRIAILDLAERDIAEVPDYVRAALNDYRDVLYWAYYYDVDPFWVLSELIDGLVKTRRLTKTQAFEIRNRYGVTNYDAIFRSLIWFLEEHSIAISAEQLELMREVGRRLKIPAKTWQNVTAGSHSK
jgi:hypothetical protein